jgi:diaminopimelate epimerase
MIDTFSKLHGAGNDFIIVNDPGQEHNKTQDMIRFLCDRKRGIGADGIIFLSLALAQTNDYDVIMEFYNNDGSRAEMCGNGLRCAAFYANKTMNLSKSLKIKTDAGILETEVLNSNSVKIQIPVISDFEKLFIDGQSIFYGDTGVPHAVIFTDNIKNIDINELGSYYRNHKRFAPRGTNVDFIQKTDSEKNLFIIRTYERGVEAETSACGTGICAAAFSLYKFCDIQPPFRFLTKEEYFLEVDFSLDQPVKTLYLTGPVAEVFFGKVIKQ